MPQYKILKFFPISDDWGIGDIISLADPKAYLDQELVEEVRSGEDAVSKDPEFLTKESGNPFLRVIKKILKK